MEKLTSEIIAPVFKEIYSDAIAPAMREFGKIGEDAVKVARLALFPSNMGLFCRIDLPGTWPRRWKKFLKNVASRHATP